MIYADFEAFCQPVDVCYPEPSISSTTKDINFEANSFAYKVVCTNSEYTKPNILIQGRKMCAKYSFDSILEEEKIHS